MKTVNQRWLNQQIKAEFLDIEYHVAHSHGIVIDQLVFRRQKDGWLVIVKGSKGRYPLAAFLSSEHLADAMELIGDFAAKGILSFSEDKWPSKHLKSNGTLKNPIGGKTLR